MDRSTYIGSSDARDILEGSFDRLYREKMGLQARPDLSDSFAVQIGRLTEDFHLDWTLRRLNEERGQAEFEWSKSYTHPDKGELQHYAELEVDGVPFGSHPDALLRHISTGTVLPIEVKMTGRWGSAEEASDYYMPQLQHHMLCWGVDKLLFSVVVGTSEPERIWVGFSQDWADHYIAQAKRFWAHITDKSPPAPAFFDDTRKPTVPTAIKDSVPINGFKRRCIANDNFAQGMVGEFIETKKAANRHEQIKTDLKELMKPDENELYSDVITLKRDKRGAIRITVKEDAA
ncbi:hypothetical protein [Rhodobacter lacus]|uniref:YqaJ viral recombinase domain-containing protein n=1 Tax=Rhodobacter lacus TaxID=1641972 RepID=A0ABW5ABQ8_9RHOB